MAVLSSRALHEQLCIIMGALTKAAVAEICELVDEGYAALRAEVSRSRQENEALKKKLHLIESIVVRGGGGGGGGDANAAAGATEAQVAPPGESGRQADAPPPPLQRQADSDGGAPAADPGGGGGAEVTVVLRDELPDVVLIKDEDSDTNDSFEEDNRADGGTGGAREGGAREAVVSTCVGRNKKRRWTGSDASDGKPKSVFAVDSSPGEAGHSGQLDGEGLDALEAVCSYASQMERERPPAYFSGGAASVESPPSRAELDLSLTWTNQAKGAAAFTHFHQSENADDAFGIKLISVSGSASTDSQLSESSGSAFEFENGDGLNYALYREPPHHQQGCAVSGRGKRFVCAVCSRTYATAQNLDVHMRIHTGERPFSCEQCGKKFTQSAHLKSHLSVHTGERPHACAFCSRSFIVKYSLKLHMKKCHPDAPSD